MWVPMSGGGGFIAASVGVGLRLVLCWYAFALVCNRYSSICADIVLREKKKKLVLGTLTR